VNVADEVALATALGAVIERAVSAYQSAKAGTVSVSEALAHISAMLEAMPVAFAEDDAKAEESLDEKFK